MCYRKAVQLKMSNSISTTAADLKADFPHPDLPKFTGKPQFIQVREIEKLIEENAGAIESSLPGTQDFNHIFLIKTNEEWTNLTGLPPVVLPPNPPEPVINDRATAAQIAQLNQQYSREKNRYRKTQAMKKLLVNQIISSFESKYVDCLRNGVTRQINHTIPQIFRVLYNYCQVKGNQVREKEQELLAGTVDLDSPLLILFKEIEEFRTLARASGIPKSNAEILELTLTMLKKCGTCMTQPIIRWNNRPEAEKTWTNIITHFQTAQADLEKASDFPIGQTSFHSVNSIAQEVARNVNQDLQQQLHILQQTVQQALTVRGSSTDQNNSFNDYTSSDDENNPPSPLITPTTKLKQFFDDKINSIQDAHKKEMKQLKQELRKYKANNASSESSDRPNNKRKREQRRGRSGNNNRSGNITGTYQDGNRFRDHVDKYCWTHGACGHPSSDCSRPTQGHKKNATFKNKMGGSQAFCQHAPTSE